MKRIVLKLLSVLISATCLGAERPNILIIFTDDQGYGDVGCYGNKLINTPRLNQLAEEGTRFTQFYAQPTCAPSRSALWTGRDPQRKVETPSLGTKARAAAQIPDGLWDEQLRVIRPRIGPRGALGFGLPLPGNRERTKSGIRSVQSNY